MRSGDTNFSAEMAQLRDIEFGERFEPYLRLIAVAFAGVLIYFYTGWLLALLWPVILIICFAAYSAYVTTRKGFVGQSEVTVATILLFIMQASYSWLPMLMLTGSGQDFGLKFVGGILLCTQLVFLVRRSDTLRAFANSHILLVGCVTIASYLGFMQHFHTPLAYIGAGLAVVGLNFYFAQSLRVARRIRQDREAAALQAHQAQKMATIGQLAGGVAHDFNNNLTAIIGSLELMQEINDPDEQAIDVENALFAARQAATTVKHLMIFARREKPDITLVALQSTFEELHKLTRRLIPTSVTFEVSLSDPALKVSADRHQLLSALVNLVVNGVDAMPDGGVITLHAARTQITSPKPSANGSQLVPGQYVEINVSDTGDGIPADILPKVIDPFFTTKPVGKGTGLGLSMVAGMLQELNGGLSITSKPKETCIRLFLPASQAQPM